MQSWKFEAIGTQWVIDVSSEISEAEWTQISQRITRTITDFDNYYSRFIPDSFINSLKSKKGTIEVEEDFVSMLWAYLPLYHLTEGQFTPLVGQLLADAGYDENYSFDEKELTNVPALTNVVEVLDPNHINLKQPALFDFGAIGKGYLIDKVADILRAEKIKEFTVDAGGDIVYETLSDRKLTIGLEHPDDITKIIGTVQLQNRAICGSAGNRRKWGRFHHIINPKTKISPKDVVAVWVLANKCAVADGLSTALFFVEPEILARQFNFDYIIIKNGGVRYSKNLAIEFV